MNYITSSRPYANSSPHLGTAMDQVYGDFYNRYFKKFDQNSGFFSAGTDEHGLKMYRSAIEKNLNPQDYVDQRLAEFKEVFTSLEVEPDVFGRTASDKHKWFANYVWNILAKKELIIKKSYDGLYCIGCEDFYAESQLINGKCPIHQHLEIEKVSETNYFLDLSKLQPKIKSYLETVKINDKSIISEMKNILDDLHEVSISRPVSRIPWGVNAEADNSQVMYVWFEALISYISCLVEDADFDELCAESDLESKSKIENKIFEKVKAFTPQKMMIMGRDNSKFHLIIWPAILFGIDLLPPASALIHGMILDNQGRKFAKSLGNGLTPDEIIKTFGVDGLRFFILKYCNSVGDTDFDFKRLTEQYNSYLADNYGNLVMRITTLCEKHLDIEDYSEKSEIFVETDKIVENINNLMPERAFESFFEESAKINAYLENHKPWSLVKTNPEEAKLILLNALENIKVITSFLELFLPTTGSKVEFYLSQFPIKKSEILFNKVVLDEN